MSGLAGVAKIGGPIAGAVIAVSACYWAQKERCCRFKSEKDRYQDNYDFYEYKRGVEQIDLKQAEDKLKDVNSQLAFQTQNLQNLDNQFVKEMKGLPLLMALGLTGQGKSTFCNRLWGDSSKKGNKGPFKTGLGNCVTMKVKKEYFTHKNFTGSIVDTPGFDDEEKRDDTFMDNIIQCMKQCGGITKFLLVISLADTRPVRGTFCELLKNYQNRFGKDFWKYTIIIFSNDDFDEDEQDDKQLLVDTVYKKLKEEFGEKPKHIFSGRKQYQDAIDSLINCQLGEKFTDKNLKSPLDDLIDQQTKLNAKIRLKQKNVQTYQTEMEKWQKKLQES